MTTRNNWRSAGGVDQLADDKKRAVVQVQGHTLVLIEHRGQIYALDNRCPHMGFPLHQGTVQDGILTCHWHHARFDLCTGGTFDPWADDVASFPVEVRGEEIWVDLSEQFDAEAHQEKRLQDGLERDLPLVLAKSVIAMDISRRPPSVPFGIGLKYGVRYRSAGWGQGLTILACMHNLLDHIAPEDRPRALYHGLSAVSADTENQPPRFPLEPLPGAPHDPQLLKKWFRQFIEVRDAEGAERALLTALEGGADDRIAADMLFSAATDHRYIQVGHPLDFTNKAFEALDQVGWEYAPLLLPSLVDGYVQASRMEENNAWRHPVDLIRILDNTFEALPEAVQQSHHQDHVQSPTPPAELVEILLGDDPQQIADSLLATLAAGAPPAYLAGRVTYAAALRIARFHTSNEFGDWDTALHTFTFANAVHQGLRRIPEPLGEDPYPPLLRGVWDAAMSVYLDRFLNVPAAPLPGHEPVQNQPEDILHELPGLLNRQQQVNEAGRSVAAYLSGDGAPEELLKVLGHLLLREDRDFHTIQAVEASFRQFADSENESWAIHFLVAAARYLAAHAPTMRSQEQTFQIARRLSQGEKIFEE